MRRLSSCATLFTKWISPGILFGFLAFALVDVHRGMIGGRISMGSYLFCFFVISVFAGAGYFVHKRFVFDLADGVWDAGTELVVKNKGQVERIALRDVKNVSSDLLMYPQRITLVLRKPASRENEIVFMPATLSTRSESDLIHDLIQRVDAARER